MSDLISRSELLKQLATEPKYSISVPKGFEALKDLIAYHHKKVIEVIEDMPTAYDVDKVVDELEKAKHEIASEDYCRSINDKEKCDGRNCFECCAEYLIEIVKQGVIFDDVCEWKGKEKEFIQNPHTKRLYSNEESMKNCYCNTCGKKIKVVE